MKTSDVIISGAGIPGLTLALLLGRAGFAVTITDPAPLPRPQDVKASGRTSALMEDSIAVLESAGIWDEKALSATDLRILSIIDGARRTDFRAGELNQTRFGANIPNALLQAHAADALRSCRTVKIVQDSILSCEHSSSFVTARLHSGDTIKSRLIVGADGRNSAVRTLAGIDCRAHDYGQSAITVLLSHSKPHSFTSTEFHLPGGPFTMVPMPGNTSSLVWLEKTDRADELLRLKKDQFIQALQDHSRGLLGKISLLTNPEAWPLRMMKADALTADRMVLIAEAAHVLSPIGAQGMNLSLRDVRDLCARLLEARSCGLDIGSTAVLKRYARDREGDTALRVNGTHSLNQMVATSHPALLRLRRVGFGAVSHIAPLRALVMDEGMSAGHASASGRTTRAKVKTSTR